MCDLDSVKIKLAEALKDKIQKYWELMKSWYRRKITKEEFDLKAKSLFGESNVHLHNEFLFAILVKCQAGAHPITPADAVPNAVAVPKPKRQKLAAPPPPIDAVLPYGALDTARYHTAPPVRLIGRDLDSIMLCSHELMLPDHATLHTRMLLGAWEAGLEAVSEEAAQLLMLALRTHLKNVIQTLISHRTGWRMRSGSFQHSFGRGGGGAASRPAVGFHGNTDLLPGDVSEAENVAMAADGGPTDKAEPINLFHLRDTMMLSRQCVPVHPVWVCSVERVLAGMWHHSSEEEQQLRAVEEWQLSRQQAAPYAISTLTTAQT